MSSGIRTGNPRIWKSLLLEDVQQADLDARLEVGQLVDREDAAVRARDDAVVDDLLVGVVELRAVAALIGSMSPIRSAIVTSGVASFSW